jgi:hypothetical protein
MVLRGRKVSEKLPKIPLFGPSCNKKKSRAERNRTYSVLEMYEDSAIILDAIRRIFLTKSATAAMCTSFRVDSGRPLLSVIIYQPPPVSKS